MSYNEYEHSDLIRPVDVKALQAQLQRHARLVDELQEERCKLQARCVELEKELDAFDKAENYFMRKAIVLEVELAALKTQKPVAWANDKGDAFGPRDVAGYNISKMTPLYAAPVPPVQELNWSELVAWWESGAEQLEGLKDIVSRMANITPVQEPLITALAECRDAFPVPAPGSELDGYYVSAIADPLAVPEFVRAALLREPLSDEEIQSIYINVHRAGNYGRNLETAFARAIEAAIKEQAK